MISPLARQFFVAGSTHLAALSAGGMIAYPSVLLQQLKANDTIIHFDLHQGSWIGSIHGIAGIPSVLMPLLMQYRGRKLTFVLSSILMVIGWILLYVAKDISTLLIGESFHGLGGNSLFSISFLSVSEIVQPKYRNICLVLYGALQAVGISTVGILGQYLHWKTVGLIMSIPVMLAMPMGCFWPESPAWLAWKGRLEECQITFERLRGTDEESRKELKAILDSQQESKTGFSLLQCLRDSRTTVMRRDFYMPAFHIMVLLNVFYWGGEVTILIYSSDMFIQASGKQNKYVKLFMDIILCVGFFTITCMSQFCSAKKILLFSMSTSAILIISTSGITFLQFLKYLPKDSELAVYSLAAAFFFMTLGSTTLGFCISGALMPVKHRGIGGSLYAICICVFHASSLKAYPYLCLYVNIWGVFLIYGLYTFVSAIIIWKCIPETRNRTLQEIEEYYVCGYFKKVDEDDAVRVPFIES